MDDFINIRTLIRKYRKIRGISQRQLAELLSVDRRKISKIEIGKTTNLAWEDFSAIVKVLEIPQNEISCLMGGSAAESSNEEIVNLLREICKILREIRNDLSDN